MREEREIAGGVSVRGGGRSWEASVRGEREIARIVSERGEGDPGKRQGEGEQEGEIAGGVRGRGEGDRARKYVKTYPMNASTSRNYI